MKRTIVGATWCVSLLVAAAAQAGIEEPDVIVHGQLIMEGGQIGPGRNIKLVARVEGRTELVAEHDYGAISETDCNLNGITDDRDLDECSRYILRLRIEHSLWPEEPDDVNSAHVGDAVEIIALAEKRLAARKAGDYAAADKIRKKVQSRGVQMKDNPDGTTSLTAPSMTVKIVKLPEQE